MLKKNLEVREPLESVYAVRKLETHRSRPLLHEETKRRAYSGGCTLPLQVGDGQGAAGRDVVDDVVGDFRFEAANVTNRMLVTSPLQREEKHLVRRGGRNDEEVCTDVCMGHRVQRRRGQLLL